MIKPPYSSALRVAVRFAGLWFSIVTPLIEALYTLAFSDPQPQFLLTPIIAETTPIYENPI